MLFYFQKNGRKYVSISNDLLSRLLSLNFLHSQSQIVNILLEYNCEWNKIS